eukprot:847726-Alexandrium_andersonii.AAC.1
MCIRDSACPLPALSHPCSAPLPAPVFRSRARAFSGGSLSLCQQCRVHGRARLAPRCPRPPS